VQYLINCMQPGRRRWTDAIYLKTRTLQTAKFILRAIPFMFFFIKAPSLWSNFYRAARNASAD